MNDIWKLLHLEPTRDIQAIKHAYALQTRKYNPEEDPEGFMQLRRAYQAALDYAESGSGNAAAVRSDRTDAEPDTGESREPLSQADAGWSIPEEAPDLAPNPYADHEAIQQFLELYSGKRRKDPKAWLDYFTSPAFLDAAFDDSFTALLLEHVTRLEGEFPPTKEFLNWLSVVYQYQASVCTVSGPDGKKQEQVQFQLYNGANFEGIESILQIAAKGGATRRPKGNEQAILSSFQEYRFLLSLADKGDWSDPDIMACHDILNRYVISRISDKCGTQLSLGSEPERHPAGLRLMIHFFRRHTLPEDLYRIAWQRYDLKNAKMGRAQVLYGPLRDIIAERVPGIDGEQEENFRDLSRAHTELCALLSKGGPEQKREAVDSFFARDDLQRALYSRAFIENYLLGSWTSDWAWEAILKRLLDIYQGNPDLPSAGPILERIRRSLEIQRINKRQEQDEQASAPEDSLSLKNGAFFRHWINTGFYDARDPESGLDLQEYLDQNLPYIPDWSRRFLKAEDDNAIPVPKCLSCTAAGNEIQIRFHLRYIDYLLNDTRVCRPCLTWEQLSALEDCNSFFFLLPTAVSTYDRYEQVRAELLRRLPDTAAPEEDREIIAGCLAGHVCRLPVPDAGREPDISILPMEWFAENTERLYGCGWYENEMEEPVLIFFEQTFRGRLMDRERVYDNIADSQEAARMAEQLLEEAVSPAAIHIELLTKLPEAVYADPDLSVIDTSSGYVVPRKLLGESVTPKQLEALFSVLSEGGLKRLELSWPSVFPMGEEEEYPATRSLVFLKETAGWACLYFDDASAKSYALMTRPEQYWQGSSAGELLPFHHGKLFSQNIHRSFATIRRHLDTVFLDVRYPNNVHKRPGGVWDYAESVNHGRHGYNLDKRLLGAFPMERSYNRAVANFYFSLAPSAISCTDKEGVTETLNLNSSNRYRLQQALIRMMQGDLARLQMTWGATADQQRHVVILQDQGAFLLAYLSDRHRQARFHVANVQAYMNVEGKKYPKAAFHGRTAPAYLIHSDVISLRCALEELLANIDDPSPVTDRFAEYASENPVKERPYETIRGKMTVLS